MEESKQVVPDVVLNSGHKMPAMGMGTGIPLSSPDAVTAVLLDAIRIGYRHFDTAALYGTEQALGKAVAKALEQGLVKSRHELFITSKLWNTDAHPDLVLPALNTSLRNLGLEYVDLYLIHWPVRLRPGIEGFNFTEDDVLPFDIEGTWKAMEECHRLGLAKSVGVSNFSTKKLTLLLDNAAIPPAVNQVEMNISWHQGKLREFCKQKGIHVSAWSPLAAYGSPWGSNVVLENPVAKEIAEARNKSTAQIALRWIYEQGASVIVKSFNKERMKQNLEIFELELSKEESDKISQIPQRKGFGGEMFLSKNGPYKSLEELWDGEI